MIGQVGKGRHGACCQENTNSPGCVCGDQIVLEVSHRGSGLGRDLHPPAAVQDPIGLGLDGARFARESDIEKLRADSFQGDLHRLGAVAGQQGQAKSRLSAFLERRFGRWHQTGPGDAFEFLPVQPACGPGGLLWGHGIDGRENVFFRIDAQLLSHPEEVQGRLDEGPIHVENYARKRLHVRTISQRLGCKRVIASQPGIYHREEGIFHDRIHGPMNKRCRQILALMLPGLLCACLHGQQGPWWKSDWAYRRALRVDKPVKSRFEGDDLAVVTFPTAGKMTRQGRDLRIVTPAGKVVAHRVLQVGPGDTVRVAFALDGEETSYFAYFGNEQAPEPNKTLQIKRGVLLETWANPDGNPRTFPEARKVFDQAGALVGRDLRDRISLGHNPHGPQNNVCRIFTGWALCPDDGVYTFAVAGQNAAFLFIDDRLIIERGGAQRARRRDYARRQVELQAGLHEIKLYHVTSGGYPVSMVAWQPPGAKGLAPMGSGAFAAFARAEPGLMNRFGRRGGIDFLWEHANEAFEAGGYTQRYRFSAEKFGTLPPVQWQWDFGDGQRGTEAEMDHVYLLPGVYEVAVTARSGSGRLRRSNRIVVSRPWERITAREIDASGQHARIVAGYDFAALSAGANARALQLLGRHSSHYHKQILAGGEALVSRKDVPGSLLVEAMKVYRDGLIAGGQGPKGADALLEAAQNAQQNRQAVELVVLAGRLCLEELRDVEAAGKHFTRALEIGEGLAPGLLRDAHIGMGDVYRRTGLRDKALEAYRRAGDEVPARHRSKRIYRGNLARHVEAYLLEDLYEEASETIEQWGSDLPADKIEGYWSWMKARTAMGRRDFQQVIAEADILARANPVSNYGAKLLMLAWEACRRSDQPDQARKTLKRIVEEFPESPLAAEAAEKLKSPSP